jgi:hypothetical protein
LTKDSAVKDEGQVNVHHLVLTIRLPVELQNSVESGLQCFHDIRIKNRGDMSKMRKFLKIIFCYSQTLMC